MLHHYNKALEERYRVRNVVIDNDLVEWRKEEAVLKRKPKYHQEIVNKMKPFLQLTNKQTHNEMVKGLIDEQKMRRRIRQLQEFRRNGLKTMADAQIYVAEKKQGEQAESPANSPLSRKKRKSSMIDIITAPNVQLLTPNERDLCAKLKLSPNQYILVKEVFISHCIKNDGTLKKEEGYHLSKLESTKVDKLIEFFDLAGWTNKKYTSANHVSISTKKFALLISLLRTFIFIFFISVLCSIFQSRSSRK